MLVSDNNKNRGARGDSSFMLGAVAPSSENLQDLSFQIAKCKHKYIGSSDGVTCAHCGEHWTHEQYVALFEEKGQHEQSAPAPEKKKPGRPKKSVE